MSWTAWIVPDFLRPRPSYADSNPASGRPQVPRSMGVQVTTRALPNAATSDICAAQSPGDTPARPEARCRRCVSQVGKSPSGHYRRGPLTCENRSGALPVFRSWVHLGNNPPTLGSDQGVPTWEQNGGNHAISGAAATRRRRHNGTRHLSSGRSADGGEGERLRA